MILCPMLTPRHQTYLAPNISAIDNFLGHVALVPLAIDLKAMAQYVDAIMLLV